MIYAEKESENSPQMKRMDTDKTKQRLCPSSSSVAIFILRVLLRDLCASAVNRTTNHYRGSET